MNTFSLSNCLMKYVDGAQKMYTFFLKMLWGKKMNTFSLILNVCEQQESVCCGFVLILNGWPRRMHTFFLIYCFGAKKMNTFSAMVNDCLTSMH